jgi:hypothetical protein
MMQNIVKNTINDYFCMKIGQKVTILSFRFMAERVLCSDSALYERCSEQVNLLATLMRWPFVFSSFLAVA